MGDHKSGWWNACDRDTHYRRYLHRREFGFGRGNRLYSTVFVDVDGDGVVDPSETGAGGRTLFLDANGNGIVDPPGQSNFVDNPALFLPDNLTVEDTMDVSGVSEPISDLNVRLNITHTWDSDLAAVLVAPDGKGDRPL